MTPGNINSGSDSIYADVEDTVKRSRKHEKTTMSPEEFARQVVGALDGIASNYIWKGTNAFGVWLLNAIGSRNVFDGMMKSSAGFNDDELRGNLYQKGQAKHGVGRSSK